MHRGLENTKTLADDLNSLHGVITMDQDNYRVHVDAEFGQATGSSSRALMGRLAAALPCWGADADPAAHTADRPAN